MTSSLLQSLLRQTKYLNILCLNEVPYHVSYLNRAAEHADHEHGDTKVLREHVPPWLQDPVLGVLFWGNVSKLIHRDHLESCLPAGREGQVSMVSIAGCPQGVSTSITDLQITGWDVLRIICWVIWVFTERGRMSTLPAMNDIFGLQKCEAAKHLKKEICILCTVATCVKIE